MDTPANVIPMPQPDSSGGAEAGPADIKIIAVHEMLFIRQGSYQCPAKKGPYSLKAFRNPSGEVVVQLSGYRPVIVELGQELPPDGDNNEPNEEPAPQQPGVPGDDGELSRKMKKSLRVRKNYPTLKGADIERNALLLADQDSEKDLHQVWSRLNQDEINDAQEAKAQMRDLPPPDWTNRKWTYTRLVKFVSDNFQPCRNPKSLEKAVTEFNKSEKDSNLKFATTDGKATHLNRLIKECPAGIMVHQVPLQTLKALIYTGSKRKTWNKNKSNLNTFFGWAAHEDRGYIPSNPVESIALRKKKDDYKVPTILSNEVILDLLTKAQVFKGGCLFLFCVVAVVVALRPAEIARIQALRKVLGIPSFKFGEEPDEQLIQVIGKTRQLRECVIPPEFVPLMKVYVQAGYPIIPRNYAHNWTLLRAMVGFLGRRDLLPEYLLSDDLEPWTQDVLRHVGITHKLNCTKDEHKTALWAGDSPKMIFFHYKGKATQKHTCEFYTIASKLKLPSVEELKAAGVPDGATDSELRRLKCPVDEPNTFFMDKERFALAREAYLARCPEAAIPEAKGPRRGKGMRTKRRMLNLPKERDEQIRLVWSKMVNELAREHHVARSTMGQALVEMGLPPKLFPPKGSWQARQAGQSVPLPDEVQRVFPEGLPPCVKPVGRQIRLKRPFLAHLFRLVWDKKSELIGLELGWSKSSVEREIKRLRLPRPDFLYWLAKLQERRIPNAIKRLLSLSSAELEKLLAKSAFPGGVYKDDMGDVFNAAEENAGPREALDSVRSAEFSEDGKIPSDFNSWKIPELKRLTKRI